MAPAGLCTCSLTGTAATYPPAGPCLSSWACKLLRGLLFASCLPPRSVPRIPLLKDNQPACPLRSPDPKPAHSSCIQPASQWQSWEEAKPPLHLLRYSLNLSFPLCKVEMIAAVLGGGRVGCRPGSSLQGMLLPPYLSASPAGQMLASGSPGGVCSAIYRLCGLQQAAPSPLGAPACHLGIILFVIRRKGI